jgi:hypothetical protein
MFKDEDIRESRKSVKQQRERLRENVTRAFEKQDLAEARRLMRAAGFEDGDPEMLRLFEIWDKTFGP